MFTFVIIRNSAVPPGPITVADGITEDDASDHARLGRQLTRLNGNCEDLEGDDFDDSSFCVDKQIAVHPGY